MAVVGYDDARGAFLLMNSWGTKWGMRQPQRLQGFAWVSYDLFDTVDPRQGLCREAWVLTTGRGRHVRAKDELDVNRGLREVGVELQALSWPDHERGGWGWSVEVAPTSKRFDDITRIDWHFVQGGRTSSAAPRFGVTAELHFQDGRVITLRGQYGPPVD